MRTALSTFLLLLCVNSFSFSQGKSDFNCADECITFIFCDGHHLGIRCTKDPHNAWYGGVKLTPFKMAAYPAKICDPVGALIFKNKEGMSVNFSAKGADDQWHNIFMLNQQFLDLEMAIGFWNNLCPPSGPANDCCVAIDYSNNPRDFESREPGQGPMTIPAAYKVYRDPASCNPACTVPYIFPKVLINTTPEWFFGSHSPPFPFAQTDDYVRMYYTGLALNDQIVRRGKLKLISLVEIVGHEIGHHYGLAHPGGEPLADCTGSLCGAGSGIMSGYVANTYPKTPSESEKCAIKKLYCPSTVMEIETIDLQSELSFQVYPNPNSPGSEFSIEVVSPVSGTLEFTMLDLTGRMILKNQLECIRNESLSFTHDLSGLPSGSYLCVIVIRDSKQSEIFGTKILNIIK